MLRNKEHGFTLTEVTISATVVGIVATLAIVGIKSSKSDSQREKQKAIISSIENAKIRYLLGSDGNALNQETTLEEISPYLQIQGKPVESLFDLVQGTGKTTSDLDLGTYGVSPANFEAASSEPITASFDPNDPAAAMNALNQLANMNPNDPQYQELSDNLQEALDNGTLTEQDFANAGLVKVEDTWLTQDEANNYYWALEAQQMLQSGSPWALLSADQKSAYANAFPQEAVGYGGASALNLMDNSLLTPELVDGYVLNSTTWVSPLVASGEVHSATFGSMPSDWSGWDTPLPVVRVTDPLQPAEIVGYLTPQKDYIYDGNFNIIGYGVLYSAELVSGVSGMVLAGQPTMPTVTSTSGGGFTLFGGGGGGSTPTPTPTPAPITSIGSTTAATFSSTTGGEIKIIGP